MINSQNNNSADRLKKDTAKYIEKLCYTMSQSDISKLLFNVDDTKDHYRKIDSIVDKYKDEEFDLDEWLNEN